VEQTSQHCASYGSTSSCAEILAKEVSDDGSRRTPVTPEVSGCAGRCDIPIPGLCVVDINDCHGSSCVARKKSENLLILTSPVDCHSDLFFQGDQLLALIASQKLHT
jgi:hypothetical protein